MASKFIFFLLIIFVTMQLATVQMADAQFGGFGQILGMTNITGSVSCSLSGSTGVVNTNVPPFPNAAVQLQCGSGNVLASTTTNNLGSFSIVVTQFTAILTNLINSCNIVVSTPLASCNSSLPSTGFLVSNLQQFGSILAGIFNMTNLQPAGFQFLPRL